MNNISLSKVGWLLIAWAFFVGLVGVGATIATALMVIGTILYLLT
jgi:hypothetical protein